MVKNIGVDKWLIIIIVFLLLSGLIMVYSSTMILAKERYDDSFYFLKKQLLWMSIGLIIFIFIALLKYPYYLNQKIIFLAIAVSIAGLVLVFFSAKINNTYRWIRWGGFSIQPSEFAKISVVFYLSYLLGKKNIDVNNIKKLVILMLPVVIVELLILKEPDFGNFFLILMIALCMLFIAGFKIRYLLTVFVFFTSLIYVVMKINPERFNRILAFFNPEEYISTHSFQAMQSLYAIGSGGIFGQGLGKSTQKLFFLPYAYTDFIFSIIGEEMGLIGSIFILGLFFAFLIRGLNIAKHSGNTHAYLLVVGLTLMVVFQALMNVSVTLGILPTKGIPLPFISIGGSSLIATLIISGIIVNVSRHRKTVFIND